MTKIKYDSTLMSFMSLFETATTAKLKDCFVSDSVLFFVVEEGEIGKAIGKNGSNARAVENALNRKIKITEFSPNMLQFIKNLVYPLAADDITEQEGIVTIKGKDTKTKGLLIGRNAKNLRNAENIVKRYFDIKEIKVV